MPVDYYTSATLLGAFQRGCRIGHAKEKNTRCDQPICDHFKEKIGLLTSISLSNLFKHDAFLHRTVQDHKNALDGIYNISDGICGVVSVGGEGFLLDCGGIFSKK